MAAIISNNVKVPHHALSINEIRIVPRDSVKPDGYVIQKVPERHAIWEAVSSIDDVGELPTLPGSGTETFSYRIAGMLTRDGVSQSQKMEYGLADVEARNFSFALLRRQAAGEIEREGELVSEWRRFSPTPWVQMDGSGMPQDHADSISDVVSRIAEDYFNRSWASRLPAASHQIFGEITRRYVTAPTEEERQDPYFDGVPHLDFFPMGVPALGYFGTYNNPTEFYTGSFRYMGSVVTDYGEIFRWSSLSRSKSASGAHRLYRTDDIRTLVHSANITQEGYRTFARFFAGPNITEAIGVRESMDAILTMELRP